MIRFTALTIILASTVLCVISHPMREAVESNATEVNEPHGHVIDKKTKCQFFFYAQYKLDECLNQPPAPREMTTDYLLDAIEHTCSNNDQTKECMKTEFEECESWQEIEKLVDSTIGLCNTLILGDIKKFLTDNSNVTVPKGCMRFVLKETKENCKVGEKPKIEGDDLGVEKVMNFMQRFVEWHVRCFSTNQYLDEAPQECNGLTRRKVFGILILSIPSIIRGVNMNSMYQSIHAFINEPAVQAPLVQQAMFNFA